MNPLNKSSPKKSEKVPLKSVKEQELSFFDTFPSKNPNTEIIDNRPIKPQKTTTYGGVIDLETIPEKPSSKHNNHQFLKKKKVYDPKESIKKEKEEKKVGATVRSKPNERQMTTPEVHNITRVNKSPTKGSKKPAPHLNQLGKAKSHKHVVENTIKREDSEMQRNNFALMNKQERVQKISQLLFNNRT